MIQNQYLKQKRNSSLHMYQLVIIHTHKLSEKENVSFAVAQEKPIIYLGINLTK